MPSFEDIPVAVMTAPENVVRVQEADEPAGAEEEPPEQEEHVPVPPQPEDEPEEPAPSPEPVDAPPAASLEVPVEVEPPKRPSAGRPDVDPWEEPAPEPEPRVTRPSRPPPPGELPERRVVVIDEHPDIDLEAAREHPPSPDAEEGDRHGMAEIGATLDDEKAPKRRWRMFRRGGDR
jgi:hypothetical protein